MLRHPLFLLGFFQLICWTLIGQPILFKDLNTRQNNYNGSNMSELMVVGDEVLYAYDDALHGKELWKSNGTTEGTELFVDTYVGSGGGLSDLGFVFQDQLYYRVSGEVDVEWWRTDGTTNIKLAFFPTDFYQIAFETATHFYFILNQNELWQSDGSESGTVQIGAFSNISTSSLTLHNGKIYGTLDGRAIFVCDGILANALVVKDFGEEISVGRYSGLNATGNFLIFLIEDENFEEEIWRTDGTVVGTSLVVDYPADVLWRYLEIGWNSSGDEFDSGG